MIEILQFILSDVWIFIGFTIILYIVCKTIRVIAVAFFSIWSGQDFKDILLDYLVKKDDRESI